MTNFYVLLGAGYLLAGQAEAQDLTNIGATITVQPGATLYVGTGGLSNQARHAHQRGHAARGWPHQQPWHP